MRMRLPAILIFVTALVSWPACAQTQDFNCLAGAGKHQKRVIGTVSPGGSITGQISVKDMRMHAKYLTLGAVVFAAPDSSWMARLEIIGSARFRRNLLAARLRIQGAKPQTVSLGDLGVGATVPFELTVAGGQVTARLGKKLAEAQVPIEPSIALLACSTGEVTFTGAELRK